VYFSQRRRMRGSLADVIDPTLGLFNAGAPAKE